MGDAQALEAVLKRDRAITLGGLITVIVASWMYILGGAGMEMTAFKMTTLNPAAGMAMQDGTGADKGQGAGSLGRTMSSAHVDQMTMNMAPVDWTVAYALLMFAMWWVMMVAMMLPSAAAMILLYAAVARKNSSVATPLASTSVFVIGYLFVWGLFSALAAGAQWGLVQSGLLSSMLASTSILLSACLLIAAGVYQLTPLKHVCLRHCRSPVIFLSRHWRPGVTGAMRLGILHGAYCTACCWFLMALLFYGGVMNLYWIIGLAAFVLLEKSIPAGHWLGRITGLVLVGWGGALLARLV